MIKKIAFYDFDGTLIDTPMPDTGRVIWKERTGQEYPHKGWWGRAESLNPDVFNIQAFPNVKQKLNQDMAKSDTYTVILTSRLKKLQPQLEEILRRNNIVVDEISLKYGQEDKDERIKEFLRKYPTVTEIDLYDDREKEFILFKQLRNEIGDRIHMNVYKANNGIISQLFEINVGRPNNEQAVAYMKKYRKLIK